MDENVFNFIREVDDLGHYDVEEDPMASSSIPRGSNLYLRDIVDPFSFYTDGEFADRYRFRKGTVMNVIVPLIHGLHHSTKRGLPIPVELQVTIALRFYATGSIQLVCGDLHYVSQPTVSRIVKYISAQLAGRVEQFVAFPEALQAVSERFGDLPRSRYPGLRHIIGAIDCTHVKIRRPRGIVHSETYRNRKGYFSINVQVTGSRLSYSQPYVYSPHTLKMQNREYREHYHLKRHMSYSEKPSPVDVVQPGQPASKSENEIIFPYDFANLKKSTANLNKPRRLDAGDRESEQYYKRYNHKEVPVKDSSGKVENINLTESKLNIIETKAMKGITEPTLPKTVSMDSNIQIIKTAVQEILNNFFVNMEVFEDHKRRFNDLLMKDPHTSAAGMEEFIKEIIKRILSQSSVSNNSYKSLEGNSSIQDKHGYVTTNTLSSVNRVHNSQTRDDGPSDFTAISALNSKSLKKSIDSTIDFFKLFIGSEESENYSKSEVLWSAERLKNRQVASAGDISTFLTEKLQIEGFLLQQNNSTIKESEIPVRSARPTMYLNMNEVDELSQREFSRKVTSNRVIDREDRKSVVSKICGFFCRKLRRYSTA